MNYLQPELLEELSNRFVLGTMSRRARRRFSQLIDREPAAEASVHAFEARLLPLAWSLPPVAPSALVWRRIQRALDGGQRSQPTRGMAWPAAAAVLVAGLVITTVGWYQAQIRPPEVVTETVTETIIEQVPLKPAVGVIEDADGNAIWVASIYEALGEADIAVRVPPDAQPANDYQLWLLRDDGVPVSVGLLPQSGAATLSLDDDALDGLSRSSMIAVSLEPPGGSPEPVPTGPVLYTAALLLP